MISLNIKRQRLHDSESYTNVKDYDYGHKVTISGGKGNDTIRNTFINLPDSYSKTTSGEYSVYDTYQSTVTGYLQSANTYVSTYSYSYINAWNGDSYSNKSTTTSVLFYERIIQYADGDGDDVIEDYHSTDTLQIAGDYTTEISGTDFLIKVGSGSIRLLNAKDTAIVINNVTINGSAGGGSDDTLEPSGGDDTPSPNPNDLIKVVLDNATVSPYVADSNVGTIDGSSRTKAIQITANGYSNLITGGSGKSTINGEAGNDTITGSKSADIINGGDGSDLISGGASNDILNGGANDDIIDGGVGSDKLFGDSGSDSLSGGDGKDVITDYATGEDVIKLTSGTVSKVTTSKSDIVFTIGKGSSKVTVAGGKNKNITVIDKNGKESSFVYGNTNVTIGNSDGDYYKALPSVISIDASKRSKAIEMIGNDKNNSIISGKGKDLINGGDGADTILGGRGNDTLTGGNGTDIFYYTNGDGNDIITDYTAEDIIQLGKKTVVTGAFSGSDLVLTSGKGKITVQGGANQAVTVVDENDMAMVFQKYDRTTSNTGYEERWFIEDDTNYMNSDVTSILKSEIAIDNDYRFDELPFQKINFCSPKLYHQSNDLQHRST